MSATAVLNESFEVSDVTGQKVLSVPRVPEGTTVGDLIRGLVPKFPLSPNDSQGRPLSYHARSDREGRHLLASEMVTEVVKPGDRVVLQPNVDAGGLWTSTIV